MADFSTHDVAVVMVMGDGPTTHAHLRAARSGYQFIFDLLLNISVPAIPTA